jgi:D-alanyl-D-alanine carboxypeptidase/D-alanyl-D-alanine-endopeptidase (penicillin-binding protein 4)
MKLVTTAVALVTLGRHYSFKTCLYADTLISDGILHGNLYFKGFGDPDFSSSDLGNLLSLFKARGISGMEGNIVGDASYFDNQYWGTGWMWDDEPSGFAAYSSALSINRNCVEVTVTQGARVGDTVVVAIDPPTQYVSLLNEATTATDTTLSSLEISRKFRERLNTITVQGKMPLGARPQKESISVWAPEMYFLMLAREELARQNIRADGRLLLDSVGRGAVLIGQHFQPIDSVLIYLNKASDNLSAENMLKVIGAETFGTPATSDHGITVAKLTLAEFGIDSSKYLMVDGSGVSHYDLMTPEILVQLLRGMYARKDIFDLYYGSLPNAGVDGLLANRMKGSMAQNNLHAKTGTIRGASALSGYVRTAEGELLAFSIMMQNYIGSGDPFRKAQDAIGVLMAGFRRK